MENVEFLQDITLQHTTLVEILPRKVGHNGYAVSSLLTYFRK